MKNTLTSDQAYEAMFRFLERLYEKTGSDYLGGLLGGMALLDDGNSADPAYKSEWLNAVEDVLEGRVDIRFKLLPKDK